MASPESSGFEFRILGLGLGFKGLGLWYYHIEIEKLMIGVMMQRNYCFLPRQFLCPRTGCSVADPSMISCKFYHHHLHHEHIIIIIIIMSSCMIRCRYRV